MNGCCRPFGSHRALPGRGDIRAWARWQAPASGQQPAHSAPRPQRPVREAPVSPSALLPFGPANGEVDFFARGVCAQHGVDPAVFTSEEDDQQAVAAARALCARCPVRLPCRRYADAANPYGVYAGETQTERAARLQVRTHRATGGPRQAGEPLA
jgi:WhiB family redox-sensing transcriptional regulator